MTIYTNSKDRGDFYTKIFTEYARTPCRVFIAVAFLTHPDPILELARHGCQVRLIVRLGYPTSPMALRKLLGREGIQVRYINNESFHPKLYIFENQCAVVGSANLTQRALTSNQEVGVAIGTDDPRYDDLVSVFSEYWSQVRVLGVGSEVLDAYERLYRSYNKTRTDLENFDKETARLVETRIDNIDRGGRQADAEDIFLEGYRATYQEFLAAFRVVERVYRSSEYRKVPEETLPLRLEIDSFLSWVRDNCTSGESYLEAPIRHGEEQVAHIESAMTDWFESSYPWFDNVIVPDRYPRITRILGSPASIDSATYGDLIDALSCENSFYDRLRFFRGGHEAHIRAFQEENDISRVKKTLKFLLYGKGDPISRMGQCIFDPRYKLKHFGRSAVQELLGWINAENWPICNNRTLRSLRWLGFDVQLVDG